MNTILYLTYPLNGLLMIALAVGLGIFITRKFKLGWKLFWIGGAVFIVSQVFHIPFNLAVLNPLLGSVKIAKLDGVLTSAVTAIMLGLSAGLFEEGARYWMYCWWVRGARTWKEGLLLGAGHGGMEAMILGVLVLATFVQMVALRGTDLSTVVSADQLELAQQQMNAYWSVKWYDSLLGAFERAFALPCQIAFSILVLQVFTRRQARWFFLAVGWHTVVDAVAVFAVGRWGYYLTEALIGIMAVLSVMIIFRLRIEKPEVAMLDVRPEQPLAQLDLPEIEVTPENLDKTRYE